MKHFEQSVELQSIMVLIFLFFWACFWTIAVTESKIDGPHAWKAAVVINYTKEFPPDMLFTSTVDCWGNEILTRAACPKYPAVESMRRWDALAALASHAVARLYFYGGGSSSPCDTWCCGMFSGFTRVKDVVSCQVLQRDGPQAP